MKPQFSITPCIRVQYDCDEPKKGFRPEILGEFMQWCMDEEILGFRGSSIGPTGLVKYFEVEDTDRIRAWFKERGIKEVCK